MHGLFGAVLSACTLIALTVAAAPNRAALDLVRSMCHPTRVGVDRLGAFWVYDEIDGKVSRTTPTGKHLTVDIDIDVSELDVDSERGLVILDEPRNTIQVRNWSGKVTTSFALPFQAGTVVWMEGDQIAVAPRTAPWLAEIWSTTSGARVSRVGAVAEIPKPKAGASPMRSTLLRYDAKRRQLLAFDAFAGTLVVFGADGSVVRRAAILHPDLEANRAFLRRLDAQAMRNGQSTMPTFANYARLAMSDDGTVWLGERGGDDATVIIASIDPAGKVSRKTMRVPECNSVRFEVWQGQLVLFRDPKSMLKQCVAVKEGWR
jgi:hypothetical protein